MLTTDLESKNQRTEEPFSILQVNTSWHFTPGCNLFIFFYIFARLKNPMFLILCMPGCNAKRCRLNACALSYIFCFPLCCNLWLQPTQLCYGVVSSLCRTVIFFIFFSGPINRNKTTADFRLGFVDGLIWRIKIPSRVQISG